MQSVFLRQDYTSSDFSHERMKNGIFRECSFDRALMSDAHFISCTFENCTFLDCEMRYSVLASSVMKGCSFTGSSLLISNFRGSEIND